MTRAGSRAIDLLVKVQNRNERFLGRRVVHFLLIKVIDGNMEQYLLCILFY